MKKDFDRSGLRTWIEIDSDAIAHNVEVVRATVPQKVKIMSVIKSNAYGHGLIDFAKEAQKHSIDWFGVDSIVEGVALRHAGISKPIFVLGYTLPERVAEAAELNISIALSTFELLEEIAHMKLSRPVSIHIKVDTGMHRQGFLPKDAPKLFEVLKKLSKKVTVEGLFTHFAQAKNPAFPAKTHAQIEQFTWWREQFKQHGFEPMCHNAASGGTLLYDNAHFDLVRCGIVMYGLWPSKEAERSRQLQLVLKPVLAWRAVLSEVKDVQAGESVGYDFTETLKRETKIGICPIGYWHGFPRSLSSAGEVLINGTRARVLGRVSMDMLILDITDVPTPAVGDIITIIGRDEGQEVTAEEMAQLADTSLYEVITRINPLIKRFIV